MFVEYGLFVILNTFTLSLKTPEITALLTCASSVVSLKESNLAFRVRFLMF